MIKAAIALVFPDAEIDTEVDGTAGDGVRIDFLEGGRWMLLAAGAAEQTAAAAISSGAWSIASLDDEHEITAGLMALVEGQRPFVGSSTARRLAAATLAAPPAPRPASDVTPRELDVLLLLADGCTNAEIAGALRLSPNTVRTHVQSLLSKLGVQGRLRAVARARELGLL
jgi:DNA-binding NarL/FixJ family response regulator